MQHLVGDALLEKAMNRYKRKYEKRNGKIEKEMNIIKTEGRKQKEELDLRTAEVGARMNEAEMILNHKEAELEKLKEDIEAFGK